MVARAATLSGDDKPGDNTGAEGADIITTFGDPDTIFGQGGNDIIHAGGGSSVIHGATGNGTRSRWQREQHHLW
jgi:Ca2+-binding RTX toxin-like protein